MSKEIEETRGLVDMSRVAVNEVINGILYIVLYANEEEETFIGQLVGEAVLKPTIVGLLRSEDVPVFMESIRAGDFDGWITGRKLERAFKAAQDLRIDTPAG